MIEYLYIIGAGGLGREMAATLSCFKEGLIYRLIGFKDDNPITIRPKPLPAIGFKYERRGYATR